MPPLRHGDGLHGSVIKHNDSNIDCTTTYYCNLVWCQQPDKVTYLIAHRSMYSPHSDKVHNTVVYVKGN